MTNPPNTPSASAPGTPEQGDYLWDRSGAADPLVAALERKLAPMAYDSDRVPKASRPPARNPLFSWRWGSLIAATLALAATSGWLARGSRTPTGWEVEEVQGAPAIGASRVADGAPLRTGDWLDTDAQSSATLRAADIGHVTVHPNSRLQLVRAGRAPGGRTEHRLNLARGSIAAFVTAEPRLFFVDTPSAVAVDYGCAYRLDVDEMGSGWLHVTLGQVRLERPGVEARVPSGTKCRIIAGRGPGTPVRDDAAKALADAVEAIDAALAASPGAADIQAHVQAIVGTARPRDAVTLWHLLSRIEAGSLRDTVRDRLIQLVPPPQNAASKGAAPTDPAVMEEWWDDVCWAR